MPRPTALFLFFAGFPALTGPGYFCAVPNGTDLFRAGDLRLNGLFLRNPRPENAHAGRELALQGVANACENPRPLRKGAQRTRRMLIAAGRLARVRLRKRLALAPVLLCRH